MHAEYFWYRPAIHGGINVTLLIQENTKLKSASWNIKMMWV